MAVAAAAAIAAAAAVSVVAAFFALYALVLPYTGPAGAAAVVAVAAALLAAIGAFIFARMAEGPRRKPQPAPEASLVEKLILIARAHPVLSVGAAVAAGVYGLKNPELVAAVMRAFMAGRDPPPKA
jgi:predicted permease